MSCKKDIGGDKMICYHGSDTIVDAPRILDAARPLDFGGGFYVTTSKEQAKNWSLKVAYRNNSDQRCLNRYEFDLERAQIEIKMICFETADEKWLDFVCKNRSGKSTGEYDVVIGPVADDKVYRVVVEYENGDLDKETALKKMMTETLCDQILFHTEKALEYLRYLDTEVIGNE